MAAPSSVQMATLPGSAGSASPATPTPATPTPATPTPAWEAAKCAGRRTIELLLVVFGTVIVWRGVQITELSTVFWVVSGCSTAGSTALIMAATFCVRTTGRAVAILILLPYLAAFGGLQAAYVYYMCNHRGWRCFSAALPVGLAVLGYVLAQTERREGVTVSLVARHLVKAAIGLSLSATVALVWCAVGKSVWFGVQAAVYMGLAAFLWRKAAKMNDSDLLKRVPLAPDALRIFLDGGLLTPAKKPSPTEEENLRALLWNVQRTVIGVFITTLFGGALLMTGVVDAVMEAASRGGLLAPSPAAG